jgi:SAM-dependent methyltransferase
VTEATQKNTGAIQAAWASGLGSMLYDNAQAFARKLVSAWQLPIEWLNIPTGGVALDVGSGPGNVTASLARAAGPDGLALGVDISEPMLARAVDAQAGPNVGFLRADAQQLPFRDATFDAVTTLAVLQLIPEPSATVAEIARVLKPGGRVAIMVPTAGRGAEFLKWLPNGGVHFFTEDELGDAFEDLGLVGVRTKTLGNIQWVRGRRP